MDNKVFKRNIAFRVRQDNNGIVLMGNNRHHKLNRLGEEIWQLLDGENSVDNIVDCLAKDYGVDRSIIKQDVTEFLCVLSELNAIKEIE